MRGTTHAVHGAGAGLALAAVAPTAALSVVCVGVAAVAALGPDIDHPHSTAGKKLKPLCWAVRGLSRLCGLPAHRGLSHTAVAGLAVGAGLGMGLLKLGLSPTASLFVGLATAAGWLAALAGDWVTKTSLPHLWWPFATSGGPPKCLRIKTGKFAERWLIYPASVVAVLAGLCWRLI